MSRAEAPIAVELEGRGEIAVGTVYALGRNYAEHAREMNVAADPVVFIKPRTALLPGGGGVAWPLGSNLVHHEVELVLLLGGGGSRLDRNAADHAIAGVGIGIDLTARDLQQDAKDRGAPWARSKGFPGAAPVSRFRTRAVLAAIDSADLELTVDGEPRQSGRVSDMILDPVGVVALLSEWFELAAGDLVFTGTPAGVSAVAPGAHVVARSKMLGLEVACDLGGV